jgi:hypothetical protein
MKTIHKAIARHHLLEELEQALIMKMLIYDTPVSQLRKWGIHY